MSHFSGSRWPGGEDDGAGEGGYRGRHVQPDAVHDGDDFDPDNEWAQTRRFPADVGANGDADDLDVADDATDAYDDAEAHEADGYDPETGSDEEWEQDTAEERWQGDGRLLRLSLLLLGATLVGMIGWTWYSVTTMYREAKLAVEPLADITTSPDALDDTRTILRASSTHAAKARDAADALPMRVLSRMPVLGDDVLAARTLATSLDAVVEKAGIPLVDLTDQLLTKPPTKAGAPAPIVNTAPLPGAPQTIESAAVAVRSAHDELEAINTRAIDDRLAGPVIEATRMIGTADDALTSANAYAPLLPAFLGADKPREYLLVFQNLAEARPTGGIIGKWALVRVDKGAIQLRETGANENLVDLSLKSMPKMPNDFMALYGRSLGPVANANLTPSFPDASRLVLATWREQGRPMPAGVLSVDTVGISKILALTGPLTVPGPNGTVVVGADNVVEIVQSRVYEWYEDEEEERQDFLSRLTDQMVAQLTTGEIPMRNLATTLGSMASDQQVMAYATAPTEQTALRELNAAHELGTPANNKAMVFFTDNGGSKLDHYLKVATCSAKGSLAVRLTNELPPNYRTALPDYVLNQRRGANPGTNSITAAFYLPAGRGLAGITLDGRPATMALGSEQRWTVVRVPLEIPQGRSLTVKASLSGAGGMPELRTQSLTHNVTKLNGVCN